MTLKNILGQAPRLRCYACVGWGALSFFGLTACQDVQPCSVYRKRFLPKEVCIRVLDRGPAGREFHPKGVNPYTHQPVEYYDMDALYLPLKAVLEVGDTLVKEKGTLVFLIKKRQVNIRLEYPCSAEDRFIGFEPVTVKK